MKLYTKDLYELQDRLDARIFQQHALSRTQTSKRRILALLVETGELANETRCFKFWSTKGPSEKKIILEEYVDGIHFLLSLGLDLHVMPDELQADDTKADLSELLMDVYEQACILRHHFDEKQYIQLFHIYLIIGEQLGFTADEVRNAYFDKNKVNHKRQETNY